MAEQRNGNGLERVQLNVRVPEKLRLIVRHDAKRNAIHDVTYDVVVGALLQKCFSSMTARARAELYRNYLSRACGKNLVADG